MMQFHSDASEIVLAVDGGGISIAIDDKHIFIKMNSRQLIDFALQLIKQSNREYVLEQEKSQTPQS